MTLVNDAPGAGRRQTDYSRPSLDDAKFDRRFKCRVKGGISDREVLRTVIEGNPVGMPRCHSATNTSALFKDRDIR
jgi:hypothetical protein